MSLLLLKHGQQWRVICIFIHLAGRLTTDFSCGTASQHTYTRQRIYTPRLLLLLRLLQQPPPPPLLLLPLPLLRLLSLRLRLPLHLFNELYSRTTWVSQYQKGKTSLHLNEARGGGVWDGSGISWTICKQYAPRSRQITTPTPHHPIFAGQVLFLTTNQQCQSTKNRDMSLRC